MSMGPKPKPAHERVLARAVRLPNGCLVLTSGLDTMGYGQVTVGSTTDGSRKNAQPHRVVYEALVGPVPDGLDLDHLCHNADPTCEGGPSCPHRACVEVTHLSPRSRSENLRASGRVGGLRETRR
jgi:HNH endonuclease